MNSNRSKGFLLGATIFSILAVGTFVLFNKLIGLVVFSIIDLEQASGSNLPVLLTGFAILALTTIALPSIATRVLLLRFP